MVIKPLRRVTLATQDSRNQIISTQSRPQPPKREIAGGQTIDNFLIQVKPNIPSITSV